MMRVRKAVIFISLLLGFACGEKNSELEYRSITHYFEKIAKIELKELINAGVLLDSITIAADYLDKESGQMNKTGFEKYANIKAEVYASFFKDYLYLQHLKHGDKVFVLYFTVAGYDDIEWDVVKWEKAQWKNEERLSRERLTKERSLKKIIFNYDEGPKNLENIRIFIKNDYLILERGNLYHSLYDIKNDRLLVNEESPFHASEAREKEEMNAWIKKNLHDNIEKTLLKNRE